MMTKLEWYLENLAGVVIFFGIVFLFLSALVSELSSIGWILILFGVIWAVLDMTLFQKIDVW